MADFNWQQQPPERAGIYTLDGYEVRWVYEGGTGRKLWQATNPNGGKAIFSTQMPIAAFCEIGIKAMGE